MRKEVFAILKKYAIIKEIKQFIDNSLDELVASDDYPNIVSITTNNNYTDFKVTTKSTELNIEESVLSVGFYVYGGLYNLINGTTVDNIHVSFVNEATGKILYEANSSEAGI